MLVQNHFAEPNCNVLNFCWFDITFAGSLITYGASTNERNKLNAVWSLTRSDHQVSGFQYPDLEPLSLVNHPDLVN
jgi:hypothetical protein